MKYSNQKNNNSMNRTKVTKLPFASMINSAVKLQKGVALLEALIAILIFSFGVLGIVGLQSAMVKGTTQTKFRSDASYVAERRISMMWADANNLGGFAEAAPGTVVPELPNGRRVTIVTPAVGGAMVNVIVRWTAPGEPQHKYDVTAFIVQAN